MTLINMITNFNCIPKFFLIFYLYIIIMPVPKSKSLETKKTRGSFPVKKTNDNSPKNDIHNEPQQRILNVSREQFFRALKWWKVAVRATRWYLIWLWIIVILIFFQWLFWFDETFIEILSNIVDIFVALLWLVLCLIWCAKSYKILIDGKIKGLYLHSTSAIYWWGLLPIVHLFMPYNFVKDLYKQFNAVLWKSFSTTLVWWWWTLRIIRLLWLRLLNVITADDLLYRPLWFITMWSLVWWSILFVKIVKRVMRAQRVYLKRTNCI